MLKDKHIICFNLWKIPIEISIFEIMPFFVIIFVIIFMYKNLVQQKGLYISTYLRIKMKESDKFDIDKLKPNYWFMALFIITFIAFIVITDNIKSVILGSIAALSLGQMIVFGKYKK